MWKSILEAGLIVLAVLLQGSVSRADIENIDAGGDVLLQYFLGNEPEYNPRFDDNIDFFRAELRLWLHAEMEDNISAHFSLQADRRLDPLPNLDVNFLSPLDDDYEIFAEEIYLKMADIVGSGFSVSAGRQYLNYGDDVNADDYNRFWGPGLIIADSRSNDPLLLSQLGSHEIDPFDAIVIRHQSEFTQFDLIYAREIDDDIFGSSSVTDTDSKLSAIYASYFGLEHHQIDVYATYNEQNGPSGNINLGSDKWIVGGRTAGDLTEEIAYKAELAYQFEKDNRLANDAIDALNVQAGIVYHPNLQFKPNVGLLYTFLQHDGPRGVMAGFSAPFEGKTYGELFEGISKVMEPNGFVNPFTNMHVFRFYGGVEPVKDVSLSLDFYYFLLDEELKTLVGNTDNQAGIEIDSQIDYRLNKNLQTFFGGGVYIPGNAVEELVQDENEAFYLKAGVKVSF